MSRIPVVVALLLLSTAAPAQFLDFAIQVGPVSLPETGTASPVHVSVSNLSTTPIQPFDLVLTLHGDATLEVPDTAFFDCTAESPQKTVCRSGTLQGGGSFSLVPTISHVPERRLVLVTQARTDAGVSSAAVVTGVVFPRRIEVTNNGDEGPGSLRAAIEYANANCAGIPCAIRFNLPRLPSPGEQVVVNSVILPNTPLPPITAPDVNIDGGAFGEGTLPNVTLDGDALWYGSGLDFTGTGLFTVRALNVRRFPWDGIAVSRRNDDPFWRSLITGSVIMDNGSRGITTTPPASRLDVANNTILSNFRSGVFIVGGRDMIVRENVIYENRASGVYVSAESEQVDLVRNELRQNAHWGVTIGRGARLVELLDNRIYENAIAAIDVGVDGIDSAFLYDPANDRVAPPSLGMATLNTTTRRVTVGGSVPSRTGTWDITLYLSGTSESAYSVLAHTTATDGRFIFDLDAMSPGTMLIASAVHRLEGKEWQTELSNRSMVE